MAAVPTSAECATAFGRLLDSSSPPRKRGSRGGMHSPSQFVVEIAPSRISVLDQSYLPSPPPSLDTLFTQDPLLHRSVKLGINQPVDAVSLGEALNDVGSVLRDA